MVIYKRFAKEKFDDKGNVAGFDFNYPENFNFGYDVVDAIATESPGEKAIVWCNDEGEEAVFTFKDIKEESNRICNVLTSRGIKRGSRVLVILKRHYEYWAVAVALHKIGAVLTPATHMLTVKDLVYRIKEARLDAVICTPENDVPSSIKEAVSLTDISPLLFTVKKEKVDGFINLTEEAKKASSAFARVETNVADPMLLYFTSGTTGEPKGVIHDFSYPLAHIVTALYWQQAEEGGLHFTVAETGWAKASWGKIYGQWLVGSAVMVYDFDNFDPKQLANIINKYFVTSFCAPPTIYRYLVRKGIPEMPKLKHASTAGEKLVPAVFKAFTDRTGLALCEGYGQTETTLLIGNLNGNSVEGSMGTVSPLYNIELRDKENKKVEVGELGEVVIIPPENGRQIGIFTSYLNNDAQYEHVWRFGVYHTGDAAWQDENGLYWFHGRFDDIIKTGGYRVGPYEVENEVLSHPAVAECTVVGVQDALRGQAIKAFIVLEDGYEGSREMEKDIKEFCNSRLAEYKWVRHVEFVKELPKTISNKIRRIDLKN